MPLQSSKNNSLRNKHPLASSDMALLVSFVMPPTRRLRKCDIDRATANKAPFVKPVEYVCDRHPD